MKIWRQTPRFHKIMQEIKKIDRSKFIVDIETHFRVHKIVGLLGPRQCGKTTLVKEIFKNEIKRSHYFDLEDPSDLARLEDPKLTLRALNGLIIIDEIQRLPEIFPILRVLNDADDSKKFLILGSASRELIQQSSETLAGRIGYVEMTPFTSLEVSDIQKLWVRGGFPKSYLANQDEDSFIWRKEYIKTFLERDIPNLGFRVAPQNIHRFWQMITHYHGQIFNASELGSALNLDGKTVRHYLDILVGTFMIRHLQPWFENISKRQIKSSKIYFRDSGIFHALLGLQSFDDLLLNPKIGASWEGFALENIIAKEGAEYCYYWGIHNQAELDLLIMKDGKRLGFEFKYTDKPKITKSMHVALEELKLNQLFVIYPGDVDFPLSDKIEAKGFQSFMRG